MAKAIDQNLREKILKTVKNDWISVVQTAKEYWISTKTIHLWLKNEVEENWWTKYASWEIRRLKKDKEDLLLIIWELTAELNKAKKNRLK